MTLKADVERILSRADGGLTAAANHFVLSQRIWERYFGAQAVRPERTRVLLRNPLTGVEVTVRDIGPIATASMDLYLPMAAVQQFVSVTEALLTDLFRAWLLAYPAHFRDKVDVQTIVSAPDKPAILEAIADQYVASLAYKAPRDWFKQLNAMVALGVPTENQIDAFAEVKATRDLFVHNRGIVNDTYLRKAGRLARAAVGQPLDLPDGYIGDAYRLCQTLVTDVGTAAAARA